MCKGIHFFIRITTYRDMLIWHHVPMTPYSHVTQISIFYQFLQCFGYLAVPIAGIIANLHPALFFLGSLLQFWFSQYLNYTLHSKLVSVFHFSSVSWHPFIYHLQQSIVCHPFYMYKPFELCCIFFNQRSFFTFISPLISVFLIWYLLDILADQCQKSPYILI